MNMTLAVACRNNKLLKECSKLFSSAKSRIEKIAKSEIDSQYVDEENGFFVCNTNGSSAWSVPLWIETPKSVLSFISPPVPTFEIDTADYSSEITRIFERGDDIKNFLSAWSGVHISNNEMQIYSDRIGNGRIYIVSNNDFFAASNCISALLYFIKGEIKPSDADWAAFAGFGWMTAQGSPFAGVEKLNPSTRVKISKNKEVKTEEYASYAKLFEFSSIDRRVLIEEAVSELKTAVDNASRMINKIPSLSLSGGKDSRLTSAAWISKKLPVSVWTNGVLTGEAEIADTLIKNISYDFEGVGSNFKITSSHYILDENETKKAVEFEELASVLMERFDGDGPVINLKAMGAGYVTSQLGVGGGGGEIAGASYYGSEIAMRKIQNSSDKYQRLSDHFIKGKALTPLSEKETQLRLDTIQAQSRSFGIENLLRLDYFNIREPFRRRIPSTINTSAMLLFSSPAFIKLAFSTHPEEKRQYSIHNEIITSLMPEWSNIPYYKASLKDSQEVQKKGKRLWQRHDSDYIAQRITKGNDFSRYWNREEVLSQILTGFSGAGINWNETLLMKVLWYDAFITHANKISYEITNEKSKIMRQQSSIVSKKSKSKLTSTKTKVLSFVKRAKKSLIVDKNLSIKKKQAPSLLHTTRPKEISHLLNDSTTIIPEQPMPELVEKIEEQVWIETDGAQLTTELDKKGLPYPSLSGTLIKDGKPFYKYKALNENAGHVIHPMRNGRFILQNAKGNLGRFVADAFYDLSHELPNAGLAWYYPRHYKVARMAGEKLKYSAISQGTIIAGYLGLAHEYGKKYSKIADLAYKAMEWPFESGGVNLAGKVVLEMPSFSGPPEIVLNGWLDALLHIRDYAELSHNADAKKLFTNNVKFLSEIIEQFDAPEFALSRYSDLCPFRVEITTNHASEHSDMVVLYTPKVHGLKSIKVLLKEIEEGGRKSNYENHIARRNGRKSLIWISGSQLYDTHIIASTEQLQMNVKAGIYSEKQASPGNSGKEYTVEGHKLDDHKSYITLPQNNDFILGYPTNFANNGYVNFYHSYHIVALLAVAMGNYVSKDIQEVLIKMAFKWKNYINNFSDRSDIEFNDMQDILSKLNRNQAVITHSDFKALETEALAIIS